MSHPTTTTPKPADPATGRLAGFEAVCADCAFRAANTVRTNADQDGREHTAWATKRDERSGR